MQRYSSLLLVMIVFTTSCHRPAYTAADSKQAAPATDSSLLQMLKPYKDQMAMQLQQTIGNADTVLWKGQPESTLGNLVADAQLQAARIAESGVDAAVANIGGLRVSSISTGSITLQHMYELMPFDNTITVIEVPDTTLQHFCDHMAGYNGWPVSGITYKIADKKAVAVRVNGKPLQPKRVYKIAVNDYLAGGGDYCSFLQPLPQKPTGIFVRDAIVNYVKGNSPLHITINNRITYDK